MPILRSIISQGLILFLVISVATTGYAQAPPAREYQIKSVFIFNFSQFVEWPTEAFQDETSPFIIGILGEDPFGFYLDEVVAGEKRKGRPLAVRRFSNIDEIKDCHILFINHSKTNKLEDILAALKGRNILTVSDAEDFVEEGGMIRFVNRNKKIQFQINPEAAKAENLKISSKLLGLSEIVSLIKK